MLLDRQKQINRTVKIKEFHCTIKSDMKYYSKQKGNLKGKKTLQNKICIYLVEFIDYTRIWATEQEFEFS